MTAFSKNVYEGSSTCDEKRFSRDQPNRQFGGREAQHSYTNRIQGEYIPNTAYTTSEEAVYNGYSPGIAPVYNGYSAPIEFINSSLYITVSLLTGHEVPLRSRFT